jgi:hypothetical protein
MGQLPRTGIRLVRADEGAVAATIAQHEACSVNGRPERECCIVRYAD